MEGRGNWEKDCERCGFVLMAEVEVGGCDVGFE